MKYLCLVYREDGPDFGEQFGAGFQGCDEIRTDGHSLASEALQPAREAATVRVRDGEVIVADGPFAETNPPLEGFHLIEAWDLSDAIRIASRIPQARRGCIEVRPVRHCEAERQGT